MQVVDLQKSEEFRGLGVELLSIAPDAVDDWAKEAEQLGIRLPLLSDEGNRVAGKYGVMRWAAPSGEPGHTFVLIDETGQIRWVGDYGAPEHGSIMYVVPDEVIQQVREHLGE